MQVNWKGAKDLHLCLCHLEQNSSDHDDIRGRLLTLESFRTCYGFKHGECDRLRGGICWSS
jgi:hypothetical protein